MVVTEKDQVILDQILEWNSLFRAYSLIVIDHRIPFTQKFRRSIARNRSEDIPLFIIVLNDIPIPQYMHKAATQVIYL